MFLISLNYHRLKSILTEQVSYKLTTYSLLLSHIKTNRTLQAFLFNYFVLFFIATKSDLLKCPVNDI